VVCKQIEHNGRRLGGPATLSEEDGLLGGLLKVTNDDFISPSMRYRHVRHNEVILFTLDNTSEVLPSMTELTDTDTSPVVVD
jgi:hypothetical protein